MMIQDISPAVYSNLYRYGRQPEKEDLLLIFDEKGFVFSAPKGESPFIAKSIKKTSRTSAGEIKKM